MRCMLGLSSGDVALLQGPDSPNFTHAQLGFATPVPSL